MIQVAYYFARYDAARSAGDSTVPQQLRPYDISSRNQALELFRAGVGEGRDKDKFYGSINGDIRALADDLRNGRSVVENRRGPHREALSPLIGLTEDALWDIVRHHISPPTPPPLTPSAPDVPQPAEETAPFGLAAGTADESEPMHGEGYLEKLYHEESGYRQVRVRQGQQRFRDHLRARYGDVCAVTGCRIIDLLEAAHIRPYSEFLDNHVDNGLLLRADIHTLFDLDWLAVEPAQLRIETHEVIAREYGYLDGMPLRFGRQAEPSRHKLELRYRRFLEKKGRSA